MDSHILRYGQLFHQFIVDMYAKIESERLCFIRHNQKRLRVESYVHLRDAVANDGHAANVGQLVILPSSFTGGPRYMHEYTQDAMTYVRYYGRPDVFITFTCNPTWPEITAELMLGQTAQDRHDLLARVFRQKVISLMNLITKGAVFGDCRCYMYSIEWQKRGLPHIHILVWLKDKIRPAQVDDIISAEIPNPTEDKVLHEVVVKHMLHGPCGHINTHSPCMKAGKCTKRYPRPLLTETQTDQDGYPLYRRRKPGDGGFTTTLRVKQQEIVIDNQWVVPFNPLLSRIFKSHINVEACYSVKSIKYVLKYVNKGTDQAVFGLQREETKNDEVSAYQMGRYISSNEAVWRILNFPIHKRHPSVMHLEIHLENGGRVYFTEETALQRAQQPPRTKLTAFFDLCKQDSFARSLLYREVPRYYTWQEGKKAFQPRKQGETIPGHPHIRSSQVLGRVYTVHPSNSECFYLRLLLHNIHGRTSFQDLKTVAGYVCATYREACLRRGFLEDDAHWNSILEEAAVSHSPSKMRSFFAIIICACSPSNPEQLWHHHQDSMTEDILYQAQQESKNPNLQFTSATYNQALVLIENTVQSMAGKDLQQCGLPAPVRTEPATLS
uniref:uncharacterized protein n=1 Tax=Myxine glutinosa TaxID=7769 RepID=UPI00358ED5B8